MTSKADFSINQGSDFVIFFVISDSTGKTVDLEGYDAAMQLRKSTFSSTADDTLTVENGRLEMYPSEGKIKVKFTNSATAGYKASSYKYDLEIVSPDGYVTRVVEGTIKVSPEVTRVDFASGGVAA